MCCVCVFNRGWSVVYTRIRSARRSSAIGLYCCQLVSGGWWPLTVSQARSPKMQLDICVRMALPSGIGSRRRLYNWMWRWYALSYPHHHHHSPVVRESTCLVLYVWMAFDRKEILVTPVLYTLHHAHSMPFQRCDILCTHTRTPNMCHLWRCCSSEMKSLWGSTRCPQNGRPAIYIYFILDFVTFS